MELGVKVTVAESVLGEPETQALLVIVPREPLVGLAVAKVRSQVSRSEPVRVMVTGVSSFVDTVLASAVGVSLTQVMEMVTVAEVEVAEPSLVV